MLESIISWALIIFGFGFVIFWHELGHFLAARWAGVRVEQFAVGMGQAVVSFRKGIGPRFVHVSRRGRLVWGDTRQEYVTRTSDHLKSSGQSPSGEEGHYSEYQMGEAAKALGLGETEYRLSWLPIGGYVKPTGQDDLRPKTEVARDDPYAYGAKPVGKRMVIIAAGVVMNVILAAILFIVLFLIGFKAPTPVVGFLSPNSPAQRVGILPGDQIDVINGHTIHDFTKVPFNVALLPKDRPAEVKVTREGEPVTLSITPIRTETSGGNLRFGIGPMVRLDRSDDADNRRLEQASPALPSRDLLVGERIVAVNDIEVGSRDFPKLWDITQRSVGKSVRFTVASADGKTRTIESKPEFLTWFDGELSFAGLLPRTRVEEVSAEDVKSPQPAQEPTESPTDALRAGDIILAVRASPDVPPTASPDAGLLAQILLKAIDANQSIEITVERDGTPTILRDVRARSIRPRMDVSLGVDPAPVVAGVAKGSIAAAAGIPVGATVTAVNGQPVASWHDVHAQLLALDRPAGNAFTLVRIDYLANDEAKSADLRLDIDQWHLARANLYWLPIFNRLDSENFVRKTRNPIEAFQWGVGETRDVILKTYVTLRRLVFDRTVSPYNLMGPIGMLDAGSLFARKGTDWLIWFLALISANLAVVNFLPLPIVDGGHFCFLLLEKITGRPPSPKLMAVTTYAGLVLLLGFFLFVTYNDIVRIIMR